MVYVAKIKLLRTFFLFNLFLVHLVSCSIFFLPIFFLPAYFSFLNLMHIFRAIMVIMIFEILLVYLNSVPVYIPCAQYLVTRMNDDSIVSMQGKVWVHLLNEAQRAQRALMWSGICVALSMWVCCFQSRRILECYSSQRSRVPFNWTSGPHDNYSSTVDHEAEGSSILFQKEPGFGVRWIWVWIPALRLTSCVTSA